MARCGHGWRSTHREAISLLRGKREIKRRNRIIDGDAVVLKEHRAVENITSYLHMRHISGYKWQVRINHTSGPTRALPRSRYAYCEDNADGAPRRQSLVGCCLIVPQEPSPSFDTARQPSVVSTRLSTTRPGKYTRTSRRHRTAIRPRTENHDQRNGVGRVETRKISCSQPP